MDLSCLQMDGGPVVERAEGPAGREKRGAEKRPKTGRGECPDATEDCAAAASAHRAEEGRQSGGEETGKRPIKRHRQVGELVFRSLAGPRRRATCRLVI